jgi:hypothetical protein
MPCIQPILKDALHLPNAETCKTMAGGSGSMHLVLERLASNYAYCVCGATLQAPCFQRRQCGSWTRKGLLIRPAGGRSVQARGSSSSVH